MSKRLMRAIPNWFKRELKLLDPTYKIGYDKSINRFHILKPGAVYHLVVDKKLVTRRETLIRATFENLDQAALDSLNKRKRMGDKWMANGDRDAYWKDLKRQEKARKDKMGEEAIDQISEGLMKAHELSTTKKFT